MAYAMIGLNETSKTETALTAQGMPFYSGNLKVTDRSPTLTRMAVGHAFEGLNAYVQTIHSQSKATLNSAVAARRARREAMGQQGTCKSESFGKAQTAALNAIRNLPSRPLLVG